MLAPLRRWIAISVASLLAGAHPALATVLSDNLANATSGTESASGSVWLAASFGTDATTTSIGSVTLLIANSVAGQAEVRIYSNANLEPGSLVGTLTSPASYSASITATTFAASSGLTVSPSTTYWVVLRPVSGQFDWAWTSDNSGTGTGFQKTWGISIDSGAFWWSDDTYSTQFSVSTVPPPVTGDTNADGIVDFSDITNVLAHWGMPDAQIDVDDSGVVDFADLTLILSNWTN